MTVISPVLIICVFIQVNNTYGHSLPHSLILVISKQHDKHIGGNMHNLEKKLNPTQMFDLRMRQGTISNHDLNAIRCTTCYDSGFAFIKTDNFNAWVFCSCKEGKAKSECKMFDLPRLDNEMKRLFQVNEFPLQHFIPRSFDNRTTSAKIRERMIEFKKYLKDSVKFWRE